MGTSIDTATSDIYTIYYKEYKIYKMVNRVGPGYILSLVVRCDAPTETVMTVTTVCIYSA